MEILLLTIFLWWYLICGSLIVAAEILATVLSVSLFKGRNTLSVSFLAICLFAWPYILWLELKMWEELHK